MFPSSYKAVETAEKSSKEAAAHQFGVDAKRIREWCSQKDKLVAMIYIMQVASVKCRGLWYPEGNKHPWRLIFKEIRWLFPLPFSFSLFLSLHMYFFVCLHCIFLLRSHN